LYDCLNTDSRRKANMEMDMRASSITRKLRPYFDELLLEDNETGALYLQDVELGDRASCCTTGEVACFYVLDSRLHDSDGFHIAERLALDIRARQLKNGGFASPYNVAKGQAGTVDIAEIGAVANSLYHVHRATGSHAARYLLTQTSAEKNGAVYKNQNAKGFDVLNGDVYAAHAWGRAYELGPIDMFRDCARDVIVHITDRFEKHCPGWWPYTENWDGTLGIGNSLAYQATIVAFAHTLMPLMSASTRTEWEEITSRAVATILDALAVGPNEVNEVPWWSRDWSNVWEIYLALARVSDRNKLAAQHVGDCLQAVDQALEEIGVARFRPHVTQPDLTRTPVLTTFRKAATFAGIFSYIMLDELALNNEKKAVLPLGV
jgi:hypothetical protein